MKPLPPTQADTHVRETLTKQRPHLPARLEALAACALLMLLGGAMLFYGLGDFPVLMWDEGRLAVNALEMTQNSDWVATYYDGELDTWNTKPPLAIWLMAASMNLLGHEELALRLPSALSALATIMLVFMVCVWFLKDPAAGFVAGLVLSSSVGFISEHVARTGDYDALLSLWITVYSLSFFLYVHTQTDLHTGHSKSTAARYLMIAALGVTLAVLTKSVAGLLGGGALMVYALWYRKLGSMLRMPAFYAAAAFTILAIAGYYLLREQRQPGYIAAVAANEWVKPYVETVHMHQGPLWYYVRDMLTSKYVPWVYVFPFFAAAGAMSAARRHRILARYALLVAGTYLLVISLAQTKLPWYDAPFYPFASLAMGIGVVDIARRVLRVPFIALSLTRRVILVSFLLATLLGGGISLRRIYSYL